MTGRSPGGGVVLAAVRFQEVDQRIGEAADAVIAFLRQGPGHLVDTAVSRDDACDIRVVGYVTATLPPELDEP